MSYHREQIIDDVRRQLDELRASTKHSQMLIDAITSNLNTLSPNPATAPPPVAPRAAAAPQPAPTVPQTTLRQPLPQLMPPEAPPPHLAPMPQKPRLSTEQRILRWAAIIGSIITFVGACFGIALAIQTGLLGPVGRAVGAALLAAILLGVGVWIDVRKGTNSGVMALYVTSFLVFGLDLLYVAWSLDWLSAEGLVISFILLWTGYLGLAKWRKNLRLVLAMCIILFFYTPALITDDVFANALAPAPPILVILLTWWMHRETLTGSLAIVRGTAGSALAWQTLLVAVLGDTFAWPVTPSDPINVAVALPLFGVVLLVAGELFFRASGAGPIGTVIAGVIAPAAVLLVSHMMLTGPSRWLLVGVGAVVTILVVVVCQRRTTRFSPWLNSGLITGWFMAFPYTFLPIVFHPYDLKWLIPSMTWVPPLVVLAAAVVMVILSTRLPMHKAAVLLAWAVVVFVATSPLFFHALTPMFPPIGPAHYLLQGVALAILLVVAVVFPGARQGLPNAVRIALGGFVLVMEMAAVVAISRAIGELIAPGTFNTDNETFISYQVNEVSFYIGHMIVSISWMALASWLLVKRSSRKDSRTERTAGLIIAIVATAKLVIFDMAALDGVPRVLTFIVSGLLLIAVAAKGAQRKQEPGEHQPQPQKQPQLHQRPEEFAGK